MTFTYTWNDAEQGTLKREDAYGKVLLISAVDGNPAYAAFLASGETAADYVAPPEPEPYVSPLEARIAALEANEISDDATDSALLSLIAGLATRISALEGG